MNIIISAIIVCIINDNIIVTGKHFIYLYDLYGFCTNLLVAFLREISIVQSDLHFKTYDFLFFTKNYINNFYNIVRYSAKRHSRYFNSYYICT